MQKLLATVVFTALCFYSFAQKTPMEFGNVSIDDLKLKHYKKDTIAAALIFADFGVSTVEYSEMDGWFKIIYERFTRIKIFKKEGFQHVDFEIPLYRNPSSREKISQLKVVTYTLENGTIIETKLKPDEILEERYDPYTDLQKFTAPNVKEGSVIEVSYKINSDDIKNLRDWEFQYKIPVEWSEYRVNIPEYFNYEPFMQGDHAQASDEVVDVPKTSSITAKGVIKGKIVPGTSQTENFKYKVKSSRWIAKDVPAFKDETYMTFYGDYISKINFELIDFTMADQSPTQIMGTWDDLNRDMLESNYFGSTIKKSGFLKKITEDVTSALSTPHEKISAIYSYVKANVSWDGRCRKYLDDNLKKPLDEKKGSSAEINLLLVSMLQKADLIANPVLISTRNNGFVRENIALSSQFNYVICQVVVEGKSILLDATDRMLPINILPERCLNGRGYVVAKEAHGWATLGAPKSKVFASAEVTLQADGQLKGKMNISNDGYFGYKVRTEYLKKGEEEYVKDFTNKMSWQVDKSEFENVKNLGEAAKERYEFTHLDNFGNASVLYINPLLYLREEENPFKLEKRVYPVDFGNTTDQIFSCRLTFPDNYQPEEMPVSKVLALPNNAARYTYSVQLTGNVIIITSMLSINKSLFTQEDYPNLREFYNQVIAKQAEQIVLKKKT